MLDLVVKLGDNQELMLQIDHAFLDWFHPHNQSNDWHLLDPYSDWVLHRAEQMMLLEVVKSNLEEFHHIFQTRYEGKIRLPKEQKMREQILQQLIERDCQAEPRALVLKNLRDLLELAIAHDRPIQCWGD
jgi:hypothetical protein